MELEKLEIVIDMNTEKVRAAVESFLPTINNMMSKIERVTGKSMNQTEKNMDIDKGATNMEKQLEKINKTVEKQMATTEKIVERMSANTGKSMAKGFAKGRTQMNKDVDALVKDINAKMMQAKSQQEKLAFLKTQRQTATSIGDTSGVVRFDEQIANAQAAMTRYQTSAEDLARSMRKEFAALPSQLETITNSMAKNEGQIESMRSKIKGLQATYNDQLKPIGSFGKGFEDSGETKSSAKTAALIDKQTAAMNKLIAENDGLQQAYAQTEDRAKALAPAVEKLNTNLGDASNYSQAASNVDKVGKSVDSGRGKLGLFGLAFSKLSRNMSKNSKPMQKPFDSVNRTLRSFVRRLLIAGLAYKSFAGMASYMGKAVLSNEQFSKSLNEVKVNLATAFYPIYTAVMPALNALISWLAKATAYMASFIATLFGTTYSAAKKGANALNENIAAMGDTGANADKAKEKVKKFQNVLAGFDEINTLDFKTDSDEDSLTGNKPANGIDFGIADPGIPAWVNTFADKFKSVLKDLFAPIKAAWDKHGKKVMVAWKYALSEVGGLISSIGKSFMEVWTNGTGERFVGNLLILLADVLNIIGDIAKAFKDAWNDEGRGTALIQSIFNAFNEVLELLHQIAISFREAWNDGTGEAIAANILEIFTNIFNVIGNLASQFSKAWQEGNVGTSIMSGILGIINIILGTINKMTKATADWAKTLDFTPLLNSIDGLLKAIQPLTQNIGDGLAWFYEKVLLPIAGFTITEVIPTFLDILSGAIKVVNSVIDALKPLGKWLFDSFLSPLAEWTGGVIADVLEKIADGLTSISDWIDKNQKTVETFVIVVSSFAAAWALVNGVVTIWTTISTIAAGATGILAGAASVLAGAIAFLTSPIVIAIAIIGSLIAAGVLLYKNWDEVSTWAKKSWAAVKDSVVNATSTAGKWVSEKWDGAKTKTSETWGSIKKSTKDSWANVSDSVVKNAKSAGSWVSTKWGEMYSSTTSWFVKVGTKTKESWDGVSSKVTEKAKSAYDAASGKWKEMSGNTSTRFGEISGAAKSKFSDLKDSVSSHATTTKNNMSTAWSTMKDKTGEIMTGIKDTMSKGFGKVVDGAIGLPGKIAKGLKDGISAVTKAAGSLMDGLIGGIKKGVNGAIGGVNWVLGKLGSEKELEPWKPEAISYAKGTNGHPGGLALVNDASGSNYSELVTTPDGNSFIPKGRNVLLNLQKGSQVLDGDSTSKLMSSIPRYKNGTMKKLKEFGSSAWTKAKDITGDVWDYVSNPSKLIEAGIEKYTNLAKVAEPGLSMAKGAVSTVASGAMKMIKGLLDRGPAESGIGGVNFQGLVKTSDFGWRTHPITGQRKLHAGVDYGGGGGIGHPIHAKTAGKVKQAGPSGSGYGTWVNMQKGVYDYIYGHLSKALVSRGDNVKVGQKIGLMGSTGDSTGPHVHYEVRKNGSPINPETAPGVGLAAPAGRGVERWRSTIQRALSKNGLPANDIYTNAWLRQVQSESGGNERAVQGNIGDINNRTGDLAKGLLQTISATFNAYKHKGHGNIFNGYDNSLAAINYAKNRYGSTRMLNLIGHGHGYDNGGLIRQEQMIRVGEGNNHEMIIPLTKPSRALELIAQSLDYMGMDFGDLTMPTALQPSYESFAFGGESFDDSGSGNKLESMADSMSNAVKKAFTMVMSEKGNSNDDTGPIEVTMVVDSDTFGKIAIKSINKQTKKTGKPQIIM